MLQILNVSQIEQSRDTQARVELDNDIVDQYAAAMVAGAKFPPITVVFDSIKYYIADGWHRFFAYYRCHLTNIECEVINGTLRDATLIALGANAEHGLRRSNADKRKAVMIMLKDPVWSIWSNYKIAEACKVSHVYVHNIRKELEENTININSIKQPETRTFTHPKTGKETQMNITNMKRKEPEPDEEEEEWIDAEEFEEALRINKEGLSEEEREIQRNLVHAFVTGEIEEEEEIEAEGWTDEEMNENYREFQEYFLHELDSWVIYNNPKVIKISNQIKQLFMLEEAE